MKLPNLIREILNNPSSYGQASQVFARHWLYTHTEKFKRHRAEYDHRRYVLKKGSLIGHTEAEWEAKKAEFNSQCAYCGAGIALTRDHVTALSQGGDDDIGNIVPACRQCNSRKSNKINMTLTPAPIACGIREEHYHI